MEKLEFDITIPLSYTNLIKAKILCGASIVLKQTKLLDDKKHLYKIQPNIIEDIPVFLCHPDVAEKVIEMFKMGNIEVIDYDDYIENRIK